MYGVRYFFFWGCLCWPGFDTLDTAGPECIAVLVCGVVNTARAGSMSSTNTEGPNTASTGSMMSSTEPRVQQAVPAVQMSEMVGVLRVSRVLNPYMFRVLAAYTVEILPVLKVLEFSPRKKFAWTPIRGTIRQRWTLSDIKCGWNYGNGGAQIDGRNILHTPSILRLLKVFWYYSGYSQYQSSQQQPDEILPVLGSTRSTDPWNTWSTAEFHYLIAEYSTVVNSEIPRVWHNPQFTISK